MRAVRDENLVRAPGRWGCRGGARQGAELGGMQRSQGDRSPGWRVETS